MVKRHGLQVLLLTLGLSVVLLSPLPLRAETTITYHNPIVYTGADGNLYMTSLDGTGATVLITVPPIQGARYDNTRWSPDGTRFVFVDGVTVHEAVRGGDEAKPSLYLAESGKKPVVLPHIRFEDTLSVAAWSPDGSELAYNGNEILIAPVTGGQPKRVGQAEARGLGDGFFSDEYELLEDELGNDTVGRSGFALSWTPFGILVAADCCNRFSMISPDGKIVWSPPNKDTTQDDDNGLPIVAPDGKQALLPLISDVGDRRVELLDLSTGKSTKLNALNGTQPLAWTPDGKQVIYATSKDEREVWGERDEAIARVGEQVYGYWPALSEPAILTVWQAPIDGSSPPRHLFEREGYGIGALTVVPDGSAIVFSLVTSSARQIEAINAGASLEEAQQFDKPHVEIIAVRLDRPNAKPEWIALGGQPAAGKGTFEAVPATPNPPEPAHCPNSPVSRLIIGRRARVTAGPPNNLREAPVSGNILGQVPAYAHFLVLAGPTCGGDGLAWWRVNYEGTVGWVAEGKGDAYWLER